LKKIFSFLVILIFPLLLAGQERMPLNGKVKSTFDDLEGIYVINRDTETTVVTQKGGYFTILARPDDVLVFSALQFEAIDVVVTDENFNDDLLFVYLKPFRRELDELVIVNYNHINSESLGLVPKGQKRYTPAEAKLATASSGKLNPLGLDPLINWMSGRTAMLRKARETEKKEQLTQKIGELYEDAEIITNFKIPEEYVRGFVFYAVENIRLASAIKSNNDTMVKFLMNGLAEKYLKLISNDE